MSASEAPMRPLDALFESFTINSLKLPNLLRSRRFGRLNPYSNMNLATLA